MAHNQTQSEWEQSIAEKALELTRSDLYLQLRYLDSALSALVWQPRQGLRRFATDGTSLFYDTDTVLGLFRRNPRFLCRAYLHTVLHCLFRHLWLRGQRQPQLWDISCDIAVEGVIDGLNLPALTRPMTYLRTQTYQKLRADGSTLAAAPIYRQLIQDEPDAPLLSRLQNEFCVDDHRFWPGDEKNAPQAAAVASRWENLNRRAQSELERRAKETGEDSGAMAAQLSAGHSRRSYREFLRKFAALHEELRVDPDSFDLNYYTYGLRLYGNLPLVEPLETSEQLRVKEFVIVLDTSYSTSGGLVKEFLRQTFAILKSSESFSRRCNLRILQCDDAVRVDTQVTSLDQLDRLLEQFTVIGGGGTDFRPAFRYVDELLRQKAFHHLRGLLYFTDGKGTYPLRRPPYDTAFLFLREQYDDHDLPPWAMQLLLDADEFLPPPPPPASLPDDDPDYRMEDIQL